MLRKPFKPPGQKDSSSGVSKLDQKNTEGIQDQFSINGISATQKKPISSNVFKLENQPKLGQKMNSNLQVSNQTVAKISQDQIKGQDNAQNIQQAGDKYFKCYWSKDVKKKHKVLDEGIIIFQGNKVLLYNSDGEKIYDSYKQKLYCPNKDNTDQYIVGSFFIENDSAIKPEDFLSGKCFEKTKISFNKNTIEYIIFQSQTFNNVFQQRVQKKAVPLKHNKVNEAQKPKDVVIPNNSYVMTDSANEEIFPVFIDPYLAENMRIHQKEGVKFMFECIAGFRGPDISGCILADSMGLGKTLQTIALIWTLIRRNPYSYKSPFIKKAVVVAPVSLLGSWKKEISKWLGDFRLIPKIAIGTRERVVQACKDFAMSQQKLLLISYDQFRMHVALLENCCDLLIFDEGHRLKNMNIKTFKSFNSIKCMKRIILTGTPLQNSLNEFYSCVKFINPFIFDNEKQFKSDFTEPIFSALKTDATREMIEYANTRSKELTNIISKFVLRRKADILEKLLPSRSEYFVFLKLSELQLKIYKKILSNRFAKSEFDTDTDVMSLLTVLRKLLNHPQLIYTDQDNFLSQECKQYFPADFQLNNWELSYKFKFISDTLDQMKAIEESTNSIERIIIVSYWTQTLDILQTMIIEKNLKFVRLDGSVSAQKRQVLIDKFQESGTQIRVFLLCGKAGGTGLNLSAANRMVLMEADWNPSNDLQVMGRIWRDGQKKPVHIYRLVSCGTMEENVLQRQFLKEGLSSNVVDEKMIEKKGSSETFKQLFEFKGDQICLSYKEDENQMSNLKEYSPDYSPGMESYIQFLKRTIRGGNKEDQNVEDIPPQNEFEEGSIFLKLESHEDEEEELEDSKGQEEAEEILIAELERFKQVEQQKGGQENESDSEMNNTNADSNLETQDQLFSILEKYQKQEIDENDDEDDDENIFIFKKKEQNAAVIIPQNIISIKEVDEEEKNQKLKEIVEENNNLNQNGKRGGTQYENPCLRILKKLKKN